MKTLMSYIPFAAAAVLFLAAVQPVSAQKLGAADLDSLIANAQTKADHLKLAAHYTALADELAKESQGHEKMAMRYERRNLPPKVAPTNRSMVGHCKKLAQSLSEASNEARQMAADHTAMAEQVSH
jgi:hypothetical protein